MSTLLHRLGQSGLLSSTGKLGSASQPLPGLGQYDPSTLHQGDTLYGERPYPYPYPYPYQKRCILERQCGHMLLRPAPTVQEAARLKPPPHRQQQTASSAEALVAAGGARGSAQPVLDPPGVFHRGRGGIPASRSAQGRSDSRADSPDSHVWPSPDWALQAACVEHVRGCMQCAGVRCVCEDGCMQRRTDKCMGTQVKLCSWMGGTPPCDQCVGGLEGGAIFGLYCAVMQAWVWFSGPPQLRMTKGWPCKSSSRGTSLGSHARPSACLAAPSPARISNPATSCGCTQLPWG